MASSRPRVDAALPSTGTRIRVYMTQPRVARPRWWIAAINAPRRRASQRECLLIAPARYGRVQDEMNWTKVPQLLRRHRHAPARENALTSASPSATALMVCVPCAGRWRGCRRVDGIDRITRGTATQHTHCFLRGDAPYGADR